MCFSLDFPSDCFHPWLGIFSWSPWKVKRSQFTKTPPQTKRPTANKQKKPRITSWSWRSWTVPIWSVCSILRLHLFIQRVFSHWLSSQACLNKQQHMVPGHNRNVFYRQVNTIPNGFSCPHHEGILSKSHQIMFQSLDTKQSWFRALWLCFGLWFFYCFGF